MDIVIISDARSEALHRLTLQGLRSLYTSEPDIRFNTVVVESNKEITYDMPHVQTVHPEVPFGYHRYLNLGRKMGHAEFVCLCNNDLLFHPGWCKALISEMEKDRHLLSTSPYCQRTFTKYNIMPRTGLHHGYTVRRQVAGWCIFQRRNIYDIIGDLDEQFTFWFADNDYAETLRHHRVKHALVTNALVTHEASTTLNILPGEERLALTRLQEALFKQKWAPFVSVFVINLEQEKARMKRMEDQLSQAQVPYTRQNAFYGPSVNLAKFMRWRWVSQDMNLRPAELGVFISHLHIIVFEFEKPSSDLPILILEDDVILPADLKPRLKEVIATAPPDWDIIFLGGQDIHVKKTGYEGFGDPIEIGGIRNVGCFAYLVNRASLPRVVKALVPIRNKAIDVAIKASDLRKYYAIPPLVQHDYTLHSTRRRIDYRSDGYSEARRETASRVTIYD